MLAVGLEHGIPTS